MFGPISLVIEKPIQNRTSECALVCIIAQPHPHQFSQELFHCSLNQTSIINQSTNVIR